MADSADHSVDELDVVEHSSSLERIIELALLAELTQEAWFGRGQVVDVLHSTVDAFGHDVVLECGQVLRHVQLKARRAGGKTARYKINTRLAERPSGCVIWIEWSVKSHRIDMQYRWFGGSPGEPLPDLGDVTAKHSKANAEGVKNVRPGIRVVPLTRFAYVESASELVGKLFGPISTALQ